MLYLDLDGVLADFAAGLPPEFHCGTGRLPDAIDKLMWDHIYAQDAFFRNLPPCPGALAFVDQVAHLHPVILTACHPEHYEDVAAQKRAWVHKHLGKHIPVLPVAKGKYKALFMHAPGDILIDDYDRNINNWAAAGGIGILHRDFATTTRSLQAALLLDRTPVTA